MRVKAFIITSVALATSVATAESQSFEPGTIAVLPFGGRGEWRGKESAWTSYLAIASALKAVLREGNRLPALLDRTGDARRCATCESGPSGAGVGEPDERNP